MKIYYINFNAGELYYLHFLFLNISNFLSYKNLRTINDNFLLSYYVVYIIKDFTHNNAE